jgi:hypothetical protein
MAFTLVFSGELRGFEQNPFRTETPFGKPQAACIGDALEQIDDLRELLEEALNSRAPDYADANNPGWSERARTALGRG